MYIDAHQHFWHFEKSQYPWITDDIPALQRHFLPADLAATCTRHHIDGTVAVQARQAVHENDYLLQLAAANPWIRGVVGWIELTAPEAVDQIRGYATYTHFKGVRYTCSTELWELQDAYFEQSMRVLADRNLTFDLLVHTGILAETVRLVEAYPDNRFVLNHIGKPNILAGQLAPWDAGIQRLGACPNVVCKVSGLVSRPGHAAIPQAGFVPFLDVVFKHFGPKRLMFGSDWPVCTLCKTYAEVLAIVQSYIAGLTHSEQEAVMGQTALRTYRLIA